MTPDTESDHPICRCQNCGRQFPESELKAISDVCQRVEPGERMPPGECPECGALAQYVVGEPSPEPEAAGFDWAIVEIFGHRRHLGRIRVEDRFGAKVLRIDIPSFAARNDKTPAWETRWYAGSAIFSLVLTDEDSVMRIARRFAPPAFVPLPAIFSAPADDEDAPRDDMDMDASE